MTQLLPIVCIQMQRASPRRFKIGIDYTPTRGLCRSESRLRAQRRRRFNRLTTATARTSWRHKGGQLQRRRQMPLSDIYVAGVGIHPQPYVGQTLRNRWRGRASRERRCGWPQAQSKLYVVLRDSAAERPSGFASAPIRNGPPRRAPVSTSDIPRQLRPAVNCDALANARTICNAVSGAGLSISSTMWGFGLVS